MMAFRKHILVAVASLLGVVVMSVPGEVQAQEVEERDHPASRKSFV